MIVDTAKYEFWADSSNAGITQCGKNIFYESALL